MPKINFNPKSIGAVLGMGALCATLAITPIATNLLVASEPTYAASMWTPCTEPMPDSWVSVKISEGNYIDALNSAKTIPGIKAFSTLIAAYMEVLKVNTNIITTLKNEAQAAGYNDTIYTEYDINKIKQSAGYNENTALKAAVEKAESALATNADKYKTAVQDNEPSINLGNASTLDEMHEVVLNAWEARYGDNFGYYANLTNLINDGDSYIDGTKDENRYKEFFEIIVCSAKKIKPDFEVVYATSTNPFGSTNTPSIGGNTNQPSTGEDANQPTDNKTTIENGDQNVKVSGVNININYTLNVNPVSTDDLKLTGNDFKSSLNQAFYDIFIKDNQNNVISNTGEVEVSIKLPDGMNPKNDFVVYYVPVAANGEYLTDQAEAIKGVKVSVDGWLTFTTNHFSVYGIVEYPKNKAPNTGVVAQNENSATTAGVKVFAGIVATLTTTGASIVARRQILRRKAGKQA